VELAEHAIAELEARYEPCPDCHAPAGRSCDRRCPRITDNNTLGGSA
jgi:hypothetical protein